MNGRTLLLASFGALVVLHGAYATPSVEIESVIQRWPWNNKVDITYKVMDGQNLVNGIYYKLVFTVTVGGSTYTIDGVTDVGASANTGTHTITWTAPSGIKPSTASVFASLYEADAPSGDDYLIVDLATGSVSYEGLLASQEASNQRYNAALYKTDKLVLRRVAAGGTYPTGDNANFPAKNSARTWTTDRDYYIGIFMVTQSQYAKVMGSNPSTMKTEIEGDTVAHRPVEHVAWTSLRGVASAVPTNAVEADANGGFLPRLKAKTGLGFDLPTEVMFEIATRAGATSVYSWGGSLNHDYIVYYGNTSESPLAVGSKKPNDWGLYDTAGNMWEWMLDGSGTPDGSSDPTNSNMANKVDPWTPTVGNGRHVRLRGGVSWQETRDTDVANYSRASCRNDGSATTSGSTAISFRVVCIKEP